METKTVRATITEAKAEGSTGTATAVVSVFGNVDLGGDRMMPGAFDKTLADWQAKGDPIPVIWSHDWSNPESFVGYADPSQVKATEQGLVVPMTFDLDRARAEQVHHLLKTRRVTQFSFGYFASDYEMVDDPTYGQVRELKAVDLFEVGPTLLGMNPETQLLEAASALRDRKAGRVLSSKNETLIRSAHEALSSVLATLEEGKAADVPAVKIAAPAWMQANAQQGLDWYDEGLAGDGVTAQTITEARAMAAGNVTEDKATRMAAWFARHMVDLDAPDADPSSPDYPSPGVVAAALWGGGSRAESERAMAWAEAQTGAKTAQEKAWECAADPDLPIDDTGPWDGAAARARVFAWAGFDGDSPNPDMAERAFLVYDNAAPELRGSYKLGFADIVDGELTAIGNGLRQAASRLPQTDASAASLEAARVILDGYFLRMSDGNTAGKAADETPDGGSGDRTSTIDQERLLQLLTTTRYREE